MAENGKDKTTRVTESKIGVIGDHVTFHGDINFYQSDSNKDANGNSERTETPSQCEGSLRSGTHYYSGDVYSLTLASVSAGPEKKIS